MSATRRDFMRTAMATAAAGVAMLRDDALQRVQAAVADVGSATYPNSSRATRTLAPHSGRYDVDRSLINLNNGGVAPAPRVVLNAMHSHVEFTNHLPPRHLWDVPTSNSNRFANVWRRPSVATREELAIVRNASEALETLPLRHRPQPRR